MEGIVVSKASPSRRENDVTLNYVKTHAACSLSCDTRNLRDTRLVFHYSLTYSCSIYLAVLGLVLILF